MTTSGRAEPLAIVVGDDALALRVCSELTMTRGVQVAVLGAFDGEFRAAVEARDARYVPRTRDEREGLLAAGAREADVVIALTSDDHLNLQYVLSARDLNPSLRVVLRQFNRTLGRKIEQNLHDCSVVSLSSQSAATYASAAVDAAYFYGLQFPDIDGPLVAFAERVARDAGVDGCTVAEAEARLGARIVAVGNDADPAPDLRLEPTRTFVAFGVVSVRRSAVARRGGARGVSPVRALRAFAHDVRHLDRVARQTLAVAAVVFAAASIFFAHALHLDPLTSAYFVLTTMTTTGYGDISPVPAGVWGKVAAMLLILAGVTFTNIYIAVLNANFLQARVSAVQGLRRVRRRGHVVVCGAGNVGGRVLDFLLRLGCAVVVVESAPRPDVVVQARLGRFTLLAGDATKDTTLDLCNLGEAAALVALTQDDTMNLEVALGARARNAELPIVMRVQDQTFEASVKRHFGFDRVFGTTALAAPVLAGLSREPGVRGRVTIAGREYAVVELRHGEALREPPVPTCVALATFRDGCVVPLRDFADARPHERVLYLYPVWQFRRTPEGPLARDEALA